MSLVIPPGFAQAVYRCSLTGDPEEMLWTIGVDITGDPQTVVDALHNTFISGAAYPAGAILLGYTFLGVRLYVGQDGGPPAVFESNAVTVAGTNAGPALPPNCAFLVQKRSASAGRRNRGRMFLPAGFGVGEDSVPVTGVMAEAQRAALDTRNDAAFDLAGPYPKVIFHDEATPGGSTPTVITTLTTVARLATVRRRLRP